MTRRRHRADDACVLQRAGLHRQCLFGGLRIGLYEPVKKLIVGKDHVGDVSLLNKIAAGLLTGARVPACQRYHRDAAPDVSATPCCMQARSPFPSPAPRTWSRSACRPRASCLLGACCMEDVRFLERSADVCRLRRSVPRKYPSAFGAYSIIARQEGVAGLWTGVGPNISRNAIINAAELASYDQARHWRYDAAAHLLHAHTPSFPMRRSSRCCSALATSRTTR